MNEELLDAEYRQILYIIKLHINQINDCHLLERYRIWLERLSNVFPSEKFERNKFLLELANQIHENVLKKPFTQNPPKGLLPTLRSYQDDIKTSNSFPQKRKHNKAPFQKIGSRIKSETSSWCDLSETTEDEVETIRDKSTTTSPKHSTVDVETQKSAQHELEALKMRMKDLLEVKNALKDTHCLTEDRKKTVELLQTKLSQAEQQNLELQSLIEQQEKQLVELDKLKKKELDGFKEKFKGLREQEVEYLKEFHRNEIDTLEKCHTVQIMELQKKISGLETEFEEKLKKFEAEKHSEILQLRNRCGEEQVNGLKRCLSKLDKALKKNEKEYGKKVEKLRQELEVKEAANQMQLQTQRADLLMRSSSTKQEELKNALNSLEGKYKQMMENLQMRALEAKKHDDKKIEQLLELLQKHNIPH